MWLWLIQRDLECIYTFANVPATLLYYPNFYCKNSLSAIWWSTDFWGLNLLLILQLISLASLGEALSKTAGRFPFRKLQKMHFLGVLFQWHLASFVAPMSLRSHWFRASAAGESHFSDVNLEPNLIQWHWILTFIQHSVILLCKYGISSYGIQ